MSKFWTPELINEFFDGIPDLPGTDMLKKMEAFKASKEKKEWEVVALKDTHYGTDITCKNKLPILAMEQYLDKYEKGRFVIHSIRRLSDNEIFDKDEVVQTPNDGQHHIGGFEIKGNTVYALFSVGQISIEHLKKLPAALFTTTDGKEIYPGDEFWYLNYLAAHPLRDIAVDKDRYAGGETLFFSTPEAAQSWITENKPCLSVKDVREACEFLYTSSKDIIIKKAIEIVKAKLHG